MMFVSPTGEGRDSFRSHFDAILVALYSDSSLRLDDGFHFNAPHL